MGCRTARHLWLLFKKDLVLMWRSKVWTAVEILLPILFIIPFFYMGSFDMTSESEPAAHFQPLLLRASLADATDHFPDFWRYFLNARRNGITNGRVRQTNNFTIGYVTSPESDAAVVTQLLTKLAQRFSGTIQNVVYEAIFEKFSNDALMKAEMSKHFRSHVAGISFDTVNAQTKRLAYTIFAKTNNGFQTKWQPKGVGMQTSTRGANHIYPPRGSYGYQNWTSSQFWDSGAVSLQAAIDSIFIEHVSGSPQTARLLLQRFPIPAHTPLNPITSLVTKYLSIWWGVMLLPAILHTTSTMASENESGMKSFLGVMGLSRYVWFTGHVFMALLKIIIFVILFGFYIAKIADNIPMSTMMLICFIYSFGAVVFAGLLSTFLKSGNAIKVSAILWILLSSMNALGEFLPGRSQVLYCHLLSLNMCQALGYIFEIYEKAVYEDIGWSNMFDQSSEYFSLGSAIMMMMFDVLWMGAFMLLIDSVKTSTHNPFSKLKYLCSKNKNEKVDESHTPVIDENMAKANKPADISIKGLVKIWSNGERAVKGMDIDIYEGGVTILLGHNGAGKTTTFSVISGETPPTEGEVLICDHNIRSQLSKCQENIGFCPQQNAIFNKLTVNDHLKFFYQLKGASSSNMITDCDTIMKKVNLEDKKNTQAAKLSGGMKRKLCTAMALVGGSKVILLDEPTAGMDPTARQEIEALLAEEKKHRTILLTTHYMDEAEVLGDRVAIMARGRLQAYGTIDFLKKRFGSGYILNVVAFDEVDVHACAEKTFEYIKTNYVATATLDPTMHGKQFEITLAQDMVDKFPHMLGYIEANAGAMNISSFGLSLNSLEQIFLKIDGIDHTKEEPKEAIIIQKTADRRTGASLWMTQLYAMLLKRFYYFLCHFGQFFFQIVVPLMLIVGYALSETLSATAKDLAMMNQPSLGIAYHPKLFEETIHTPIHFTGREFTALPGGLSKIDSANNFTAYLFERGKQLPVIPYAFDVTSTDIVIYFNENSPVSIPVALNVLANARLGSGSISTSLRQVRRAFDEQNSEMDSAFSTEQYPMELGIIVYIVCIMVSSPFVVFLVDERVGGFRHQQWLTSVSPLVLWGGLLIYDFIIFFVIALATIVEIKLMDLYPAYFIEVAALCLLYFAAAAPCIYAASFLFHSPARGNLAVFLWQALVGTLIAVLMMLTSVQDGNLFPSPNYIARIIVPPFGLCDGFLDIWRHDRAVVHVKVMGKLMGKATGPGQPQFDELDDRQNMLPTFAIMIVSSIYMTIIFVMMQFRTIRLWFVRKIGDPIYYMIHKNKRGDNEANDDKEDDDVQRERERVMGQLDEPVTRSKSVSTEVTKSKTAETATKTGASATAQSLHNTAKEDGDVLKVKSLVKSYGSFTAVDHLTFGVKPNECLGLLGVNGAGKTSTFNVITGTQFATSGHATVNGREVTQRVPIGYCPQFDALMLDLTGRQNLRILALLHGFKDANRRVSDVLAQVGMEKHADKKVNRCSGGQRRRLSVAAAILSEADLVILDEPTAGIDPKARREIWDLLSAIRASGTAILLTSHSMSECEALCSRIAVLSKGKMIAVGSAQHLKSRYGKHFCLTMTLSSEESTDEKKNQVMTGIKNEFGEANTSFLTSNTSEVQCKVTRQDGDKWSTMFTRVLALKKTLGVADFCLSQASLEDTFQCLAGANRKAAEAHK